jgi:multicomponent Na+:H+ antiporter subunit E
MTGRSDASLPLRSVAWRAVAFSALWLILSGADPGGLPAGVIAVMAATWSSLRLLPPSGLRLSRVATAHLMLRFLAQSVVAGMDVARRALDPRLPLQPGFIAYPVRLARGAARNTFCTLSSLLPGTLPVRTDERDALVVHCLDTGEPIERQLGAEEALLTRVMGGRDHD